MLAVKSRIGTKRFVSFGLVDQYIAKRRPFSDYRSRKGYRGQNFGKGVSSQQADTPLFSNLIREFYKRSHPDILRSDYPDHATINMESMQVLNGVLSTIKEESQYPPRMLQNVTFFIRSQNKTVEKHELRILTAGGDCRKQLSLSFELFFQQTGILPNKRKFRWDKDYFPTMNNNEA